MTPKKRIYFHIVFLQGLYGESAEGLNNVEMVHKVVDPQTWANPQNNEIENKFDHDLHPDDNA